MGLWDKLIHKLEKQEGKKDRFGWIFPICLLLGVIFLIVANTNIAKKGEGAQSDSSSTVNSRVQEQTYEEILESKLENAFSCMEGVGKVKVVVTVKNKGEITVEKDESYSRSTTTEEDSAGGRRNVEEEAGRSETVMKDGKEPFVVKESVPEVQGVLILAQGADSSQVQEKLINSAAVLLNLSVSKIQVAPYQE